MVKYTIERYRLEKKGGNDKMYETNMLKMACGVVFLLITLR